MFNGDPLQFINWEKTFDSLIGQKFCNNSECMCYLRRYLAGDALESVSGYFLYDDEKTGYEDARAELTRQFGEIGRAHV